MSPPHQVGGRSVHFVLWPPGIFMQLGQPTMVSIPMGEGGQPTWWATNGARPPAAVGVAPRSPGHSFVHRAADVDVAPLAALISRTSAELGGRLSTRP
jgi:hypothetical protein